jgi:hypothetical protein
MKHIITFLACLLVGIGIGWYFGYSCPAAQRQRELLGKYQPLKEELETNMAYLNKQREEESKKAQPWMASSASIALAALKNLKTNDMEDAKYRLAAIVAAYYRGHSRDGDTNLLTSITTFAATDAAFSNAFYGPLK